jgi:hypothetical protein
MFGILLLPLLVFGCFGLMKKGFSREGIPFTERTHLTGNAGKIPGALCGLIGLVVLILWLFMVKGSLMSQALTKEFSPGDNERYERARNSIKW